MSACTPSGASHQAGPMARATSGAAAATLPGVAMLMQPTSSSSDASDPAFQTGDPVSETLQ